jgi:hypothetical protein
MERREALAALLGLPAASLAPTYIGTQEAAGVSVVVLRCPGRLSESARENLERTWVAGMQGTCLEGVKFVVLGEGMSVELIK